jgi:WD40-like Beta Propeller Repeat
MAGAFPGVDQLSEPDAASLVVVGRLRQDVTAASVRAWLEVWLRQRFPPPSDVNVGRSAFSPDGRWLAYQSSDARTAGVLVEAFPPTGTPNQIAMRAGGTPHHPFWSRDGKELFYIPGPDQFAVVRVTTQPSFSVSNPESLTRGVFLEGGPDAIRNIDALPDGRFVGIVDLSQSESGDPTAPRINVVLNWTEELKRLAPTQ